MDLRATLRPLGLAPASDKIREVIGDDQADWVYVRFLPSREELDHIHRAGKRIFLAGPMVAGEMRDNWSTAAELGVDAILTDYPLELSRMLRNIEKPDE